MASKEALQRKRDRQRVQYRSRKSAGLCTRCGKVPTSKGKVTCHPCSRGLAVNIQNRRSSISLARYDKLVEMELIRICDAAVILNRSMSNVRLYVQKGWLKEQTRAAVTNGNPAIWLSEKEVRSFGKNVLPGITNKK